MLQIIFSASLVLNWHGTDVFTQLRHNKGYGITHGKNKLKLYEIQKPHLISEYRKKVAIRTFALFKERFRDMDI